MRRFDSNIINLFYFSNKYVIHTFPKIVVSKVWQHVKSWIFIRFTKTKRQSIGNHPNKLSFVGTMFVSLLDQKLKIWSQMLTLSTFWVFWHPFLACIFRNTDLIRMIKTSFNAHNYFRSILRWNDLCISPGSKVIQVFR